MGSQFSVRHCDEYHTGNIQSPLFACFCSPNLNMAARRVAHYKPFVGPIRLIVQTNIEGTTIKIGALPEYDALPPSLVAMELAWWVHMPRLATREHLVPLGVHTTVDIPEKAVDEDFFGLRLSKSDFNGVMYSTQDAERPFLSANDAMWSIFEPQLNQRMQDLKQNATYTEKVRACLMEILASGQYNIGDVAPGRPTIASPADRSGASPVRARYILRILTVADWFTNSRYESVGLLTGASVTTVRSVSESR